MTPATSTLGTGSRPGARNPSPIVLCTEDALVSRDRDRILEQALKHELSAAGTPPAGACLDAETLGAWTDGGLDPAAMAARKRTSSNCARCQALVGTMARDPPHRHLRHRHQAPQAPFPLEMVAGANRRGRAAVTLWMVVPESSRVRRRPRRLAKAHDRGCVEQPSPRPQTSPLRLKRRHHERRRGATGRRAARGVRGGTIGARRRGGRSARVDARKRRS